VPENWELEEAGGSQFYRSKVDPGVTTRTKPTEDARIVAERAKSAKEEFERYKAEGFGLKQSEPPKELSAEEMQAEQEALEKAKAAVLVQKQAAEAKRTADDKELRAKVLARVKGLEVHERENSVASSVRSGLVALLEVLEIENRNGAIDRSHR